jgi:nucleoside recognition membrane protein YjiH
MIRSRLVLSLIGVGLALVAIARNDKRIAWIAMMVLAVALAVRLSERRRR